MCHHLPEHKHDLLAYEAARLNLQTRHGKLIADVGCEPILHMRHFQVRLYQIWDSFFTTLQVVFQLISVFLGLLVAMENLLRLVNKAALSCRREGLQEDTYRRV